MISSNKGMISINGVGAQVITELSLLIEEIQKKDNELFILAMVCVYSDAGSRTLEESIEMLKNDTNKILEGLGNVERGKNG